MKVSCILFHYEKHRGAKIADTVRLSIILRHLHRHLGSVDIADLSLDALDGYSSARDGISGATIRRELGVLTAAFNFAVKTRLIKRDQVPCIILPAGSPPKDLWLDESELDWFTLQAKATNFRLYQFVLLAGETASRKQAILELKWSQLDLTAGLIHFQGGVETKKRRVAVPISTGLGRCLGRWKEDAPTDYVLGHPGPIDQDFKRLVLECAKTTPKFGAVTPHTLRHTWATLAARAGVDLWQIAGVLGDTVNTVQKNYLHHCPDHLRGAVNFRERPASL